MARGALLAIVVALIFWAHPATSHEESFEESYKESHKESHTESWSFKAEWSCATFDDVAISQQFGIPYTPKFTTNPPGRCIPKRKSPSRLKSKCPPKPKGKFPSKPESKPPSKPQGESPSQSTSQLPSQSTSQLPSQSTSLLPSQSTSLLPSQSTSESQPKLPSTFPYQPTDKYPSNPGATKLLSNPTSKSQPKPTSTFPSDPEATKLPSKPKGKMVVKVYWNKITALSSNNETIGDFSDELIHHQIDVLNADFEHVGLVFKLERITRKLNADWFRLQLPEKGMTQDEADMRTLLSANDTQGVNVYSLLPEANGFVSWTLSPNTLEDINVRKKFTYLDGIVLDISRIASATSPGHTLTHEMGHWAGLYHTFEGCDAATGHCDPVNDGVKDTPAHLPNSTQCDTPAFSCQKKEPDPTDNFMSYAQDKCRRRFTPGQIKRMRAYLKRSRGMIVGAQRDQDTQDKLDQDKETNAVDRNEL